MQKFRSTVFRILSAVFAVILLTVGMGPSVLAKDDENDAPEVENKEYRIAVVFDNSGSMYQSEAWCRAKYAMEIFSAMLDYDHGDRLCVFPMWEVRTDGSQPEYVSGTKAVKATPKDMIEISSRKDIDKISNLYTLYAYGTPFQPVDDAAAYLNGLDNKYEKWLIVLTDGIFDEYKSKDTLEVELLKRASKDIKLQYLGIGKEAFELNGKPEKNFYAVKSSDVDLKDKLIDTCNSIFQRNILPANRLSGGSLKLDLSMRKVIVFAQGQNAEVKSLTDANGKKIDVSFDSGQRRFSEINCGNRNNDTKVDRTLAGQVVTFGKCNAGTCTLDCTGADKIEIFYEPDVRIKTVLTDGDGREVNEDSAIYPGKYTLKNTIVDSVTGEDVSNSELLGKNIKYDIQLNGEAVDNNAVLDLKSSNSQQKIVVTATYLGKYKIRNHDSPLFNGFNVVLPDENKLSIKIDCQQSSNWYQTTTQDDWKPIIVQLSQDGKPFTDEELQALEVNFDFENVAFSKKLIPGQSSYEIMPGVDDDGNLNKPEDGTYKFTVTAHTTDNFDRSVDAKESILVNFRWWSPLVLWLIGLLGLLLIAAIILFIMSRKVLPKHIGSDKVVFTLKGREITGTRVDYSRKNKTLSISSPMPPDPNDRCTARFSLYPVGRRWTPSRRRKFGISKMSAGGGVQDIKINGTSYIKTSKGSWAPATDPEAAQIKEEGTCPMIAINTRRSNVNCTLNQH